MLDVRHTFGQFKIKNLKDFKDKLNTKFKFKKFKNLPTRVSFI